MPLTFEATIQEQNFYGKILFAAYTPPAEIRRSGVPEIRKLLVSEIVRIKKFTAIISAASMVSVPFLQDDTWGKSSLLMLLPSILSTKNGATTTLKDNVLAIDNTKTADIISTSTSLTGETTLMLSGSYLKINQANVLKFAGSG